MERIARGPDFAVLSKGEARMSASVPGVLMKANLDNQDRSSRHLDPWGSLDILKAFGACDAGSNPAGSASPHRFSSLGSFTMSSV